LTAFTRLFEATPYQAASPYCRIASSTFRLCVLLDAGIVGGDVKARATTEAGTPDATPIGSDVRPPRQPGERMKATGRFDAMPCFLRGPQWVYTVPFLQRSPS